MNSLTSRIGFWSAILVVMLNVGSTLARTASLDLLSMALGLIVVSLFVAVMASLYYYAPDDKKILALLGVAFAIVCAALLGVNYYLQLTVARWDPSPMLAVSNPHSVMWGIEVLGYGFMGVATLFPAFIFSKGKLENAIRWSLIANAFLGIAGVIGYALVDNPLDLLAGLLAWDALFPIMIALLAVFFKRESRAVGAQ